jgi:Peptidase family M23
MLPRIVVLSATILSCVAQELIASDVSLSTIPHQVYKTATGENSEGWMWGHDVLATGDGTIVLARDDLPDNAKPGVMPGEEELLKLGELAQVAGGNQIVIDHRNGEFSYVAHLQHGSLRVKKGDVVKQGQVIAKLGNSGHATGPHLHYHLMAGGTVFRCDGLPAKFSNTSNAMPRRGGYGEAK